MRPGRRLALGPVRPDPGAGRRLRRRRRRGRGRRPSPPTSSPSAPSPSSPWPPRSAPAAGRPSPSSPRSRPRPGRLGHRPGRRGRWPRRLRAAAGHGLRLRPHRLLRHRPGACWPWSPPRRLVLTLTGRPHAAPRPQQAAGKPRLMCEYCGCQDIAAIDELTREHDAVVSAHRATVPSPCLRDDSRRGCRQTCTTDRGPPRTRTRSSRRRASSPCMAAEFPDHIEALERGAPSDRVGARRGGRRHPRRPDLARSAAAPFSRCCASTSSRSRTASSLRRSTVLGHRGLGAGRHGARTRRLCASTAGSEHYPRPPRSPSPPRRMSPSPARMDIPTSEASA